MPAESRYLPEVRAARTYLAGFGTSGSLLAGAALLFVLASAIVAFRGWPQVGDGLPSTAALNLPPSGSGAGATGGSRAGRALAASVAAGRTGSATSAGAVGRPSGRARGGDTRSAAGGGGTK